MASKNNLYATSTTAPWHYPRNSSSWPLSESSLNVWPRKLTQTGLDKKEEGQEESKQGLPTLQYILCLSSASGFIPQMCFIHEAGTQLPSALGSHMHNYCLREKGSFLHLKV